MRHRLGCSVMVYLVAIGFARTERAYADEPWARPDRLAFSIGLNGGISNLDAFHRGVKAYLDEIEARNPDLRVTESLRSDFFLGPEICGRYYFPYYFWAELGFGYLYNGASAQLEFTNQNGELSYDNHTIEMPLMVGGYYPVDTGVYLFAGIGPTLVIYSLSRWVYNRGRVASYSTTLGGGFHFQLGADIRITDAVSFSPAFRYRYVKTSELEPSDPPYPPLAPVIDLDMSGVALSISLRWFVL